MNAVLGPRLAAEFSLSAADLGFLTGAYFLSFGLFQIPLGVLLDRFGPRRTNATLLLFAAAGALAFACSHSFSGLVLARVLIGFGVSACLMASIQAVFLWFPPERTATMIAVAFSVGGLGALSAGSPLEAALGHFDWREIFVALAACTVALSAVFFVWMPERRASKELTQWKSQFAGVGRIARDPAFWRAALAIGANQCAVVGLFTLWITAWLRDVAGYDRAAAAAGLGWVSLALIAGYLAFGRLGDAWSRRGRSLLPLFAGGVAGSLVFFALLTFGVTAAPVLLWCGMVFFGTGATLAHSIATRRYPREMTGRINTMLNTFTFVGVFLGQWASGAILAAWPATATGYDPRAYFYAFGTLWLVQAAGLAWLWSGRTVFK